MSVAPNDVEKSISPITRLKHYVSATSTCLSNFLAAVSAFNVARSMTRKLEEASRRHVAC